MFHYIKVTSIASFEYTSQKRAAKIVVFRLLIRIEFQALFCQFCVLSAKVHRRFSIFFMCFTNIAIRNEEKRKTNPARTNNNRLNVLDTLCERHSFRVYVWVCVCLPIFTVIYTMIRIIVNENEDEGEMSLQWFGSEWRMCEKGRNSVVDSLHIRKALATLTLFRTYTHAILKLFSGIFSVRSCLFIVQI